MAAYILFIREDPVRDPEAMAQYMAAGAAKRPNVPVKRLTGFAPLEAFEGKAPDGIVLLEFPSIEDARAFYDSPEYGEAMQHRHRAADYRAILIEGA